MHDLGKLPLHLQDRWNRNTLLLRRMDSREPTPIDLANFVEDEMTLVNDPLYSREAVSQYVEKGPTRQGHRGDRRKFHAMATKTDNSSEDLQKGNKASSERTCPVCGERHDIEGCKYYLQQTLEERNWYLRKSYVVASKKSKRITMQRIVVREDFVKCAMGNIQLPGYIRKKVGNTQH